MASESSATPDNAKSDIVSIVQKIESELLSISSKSAGNKDKTVSATTQQILYKHLTDLKLRFNYLHPNTFSSLDILRKFNNFYASPLSSQFKGSFVKIDQNIDPASIGSKNAWSVAVSASILDPNPEITQPNDPFQGQLIRFENPLPFNKHDAYDTKVVMLVQFSFLPVANQSSKKPAAKSASSGGKKTSSPADEEWNALWDPATRPLDASSKYFIGIVPNTMPADRFSLSCEEPQITEKDPLKVAFFGIGAFKDCIYLGGGRKTWDCAEDDLVPEDDGNDRKKKDTRFEACVFGVDDESDRRTPTKPGVYKNDVVRIEIDLAHKRIDYFVHRTDDARNSLETGMDDEKDGSGAGNDAVLGKMQLRGLKFEKIGTVVLGDDVDTTFKASQKVPKTFHPCVGLGEQGACATVMFV